MKDDLKFHCTLEPEDERNFMLVEDFTTDLGFTVQHVCYGFWYRLKCVFRLLLKGIDANDITIDEADAFTLYWWLKEWIDFRLYQDKVKKGQVNIESEE